MTVYVSQLVKLTRLRTILAAIIADLAALNTSTTRGNRTVNSGKLAKGTTAGKIQNVAAVDFQINGQLYTKAATDDLWDLSAEVDPTGGNYKAWWLYLSTAGAASISTATANCASAAAAILALPAPDAAKSVIGAYVSAVAEDMNGAGGLGGTFVDGYPSTRYLTGVSGVSLTAAD